MQNNHYIKYLSLIFFTGAVVLSLELLASRILTPFFGVSLYIWTSILSITLIFLALGYQFGGWITSKISSEYYEELFIFIPFISSVFILISTIAYPVFLPSLINLNLLLGSFIGSFILLSVPLVLMSALNPILISIMKLKNNQSKDSHSGFVFFISTLGSVFGVIFTALIIVPNFTNFSSYILNALFLIIINLIIYFLIGYNSFKKLKKIFIFLNIFLFLILIALYCYKQSYLSYFTSTKDKQNNEYVVIYENPSFYGNLKVVGFKPNQSNDIAHYILYQNGFTQNTIDKNGKSLNNYIHVLNKLSEFSEKGDALVLGFGAGSLPRSLANNNFNVDVVEIDPNTLDIAIKFFNYNKKNTNIFFEDARTFVKNCKKKYNLIIIDLFFADGVPEHLTTKEFYNNLNNCLDSQGIVLSNSVADFLNEDTLKSVLSTFNSVFNKVYYFYDKEFMIKTNIKITNLYVLATNKNKLNNLDIKFENIPKKMRHRLISTLRNFNKFSKKNTHKKYILYDEKNNYSHLFSKSMSNFRKLISMSIPSRILIN
jgi:spermidine synthase|tara:strand:+ start:495 stop:2120 length:1626 start_codon:yes stop_codon:yes gene_type:complete